MKNSFSRKQIGLAAACALALGLMSGTARAQSGWLQGSQGNVQGNVHSGTGLCVHSGTPVFPASTYDCDPNYTPAIGYVAPFPAAPPSQRVAVAAVAAAPVYAPQRLSFDADALFDFDKSTLRPSGRRTLDNFVDRISAINPETIMVVGHADRVGTEQYNQRLSEDRATTVKSYLVSRGVAPNRVRASGVGEMQEVTAVGECMGDANLSAKAIACRQPDRHVDIELIGARIPQ